MATDCRHADLLADLISRTRIKDTNSGIEINGGIEYVFVDVGGADELPIELTGTLNTKWHSYDLRYTLEAYHRKRSQAEYGVELV